MTKIRALTGTRQNCIDKRGTGTYPNLRGHALVAGVGTANLQAALSIGPRRTLGRLLLTGVINIILILIAEALSAWTLRNALSRLARGGR